MDPSDIQENLARSAATPLRNLLNTSIGRPPGFDSFFYHHWGGMASRKDWGLLPPGLCHIAQHSAVPLHRRLMPDVYGIGQAEGGGAKLVDVRRIGVHLIAVGLAPAAVALMVMGNHPESESRNNISWGSQRIQLRA